MTPEISDPKLSLPSSVTNKASLRRLLRLQRQTLSPTRQQEAAESAEKAISKRLAGCKLVLSYSSINEELDTKALNTNLAKEGRLVLPRVDGEGLRLYKVTDPEAQLVAGNWDLAEPNPELCEEVEPSTVNAVIVPGIAFDTNKQRLGYGKGFYDRLLSDMPKETVTIGLAYKEQCMSYAFPAEDHDIPMDEIITA